MEELAVNITMAAVLGLAAEATERTLLRLAPNSTEYAVIWRLFVEATALKQAIQLVVRELAAGVLQKVVVGQVTDVTEWAVQALVAIIVEWALIELTADVTKFLYNKFESQEHVA